MRTLRSARVLAVLLTLAVGWHVGAADRDNDPVVVAPGNYRVLLENSHVRVLDFRLSAGESEGQHAHPRYVVYVLEPFRLRFSFLDGSAIVREASAGEVFWSEAVTHASTNIGTTEAHAVLIELK
jgi:quercetin dioxygenase-like cupin family protein